MEEREVRRKRMRIHLHQLGFALHPPLQHASALVHSVQRSQREKAQRLPNVENRSQRERMPEKDYRHTATQLLQEFAKEV